MRIGISERFLLAIRRRFMDRQYPGKVIALTDRRILYYSIPKVACSSIMAALVDALGIDFPADEWKPEMFQSHKWDHLFDRGAVDFLGRFERLSEDFATVQRRMVRPVALGHLLKSRHGDYRDYYDAELRVRCPPLLVQLFSDSPFSGGGKRSDAG